MADIPWTWDLGYVDNCDGAGIVTAVDSPVQGSCPATVTRTWVATDFCGNTSTATQLIYIVDTTNPVFAAPPPDQTVECIADIPAAQSLSWTDNCDGAGTVNYPTESTAGDLCFGQFFRTWRYTDNCGNSAAVTQTITLQDTTAPTFDSAPATITVECDAIPPAADLSWTDNCGSPGTATSVDGPITGYCPSTLIRTWVAQDQCDNTSTITQAIILEDTTPPTLDAPPSNVTISCLAELPSSTLLNYTDNCGVPGAVGVTETNNGGNPAVITRIWTALDECGNSSSVSQQVTIQGQSQSNTNGNVCLENGDVYVENSCRGVILKAPDGNCYRIVVDNAGQLITQVVSCP